MQSSLKYSNPLKIKPDSVVYTSRHINNISLEFETFKNNGMNFPTFREFSKFAPVPKRCLLCLYSKCYDISIYRHFTISWDEQSHLHTTINETDA